MRSREILGGLLFLPMALMAQEPGDLDTTFGVEGRVITDFGENDLGRAKVRAVTLPWRVTCRMALWIRVSVGMAG